MWERIKSLFAQEDNVVDRALIRERLNRRGPRSGPQVERVVELMNSGADRVKPQSSINYIDQHLLQAMNTSEALMQPGSAEAFQLIRPHPADELRARRERQEQQSQSGRFLHKGVKAQRIA